MGAAASGEAPSGLSHDEWVAWLRLLATPGIGRVAARRLLLAFGGPEQVFAADPVARRAQIGPAADALLAEPAEWPDQLARTESWLAGGADRHLIAIGDRAYPQALLTSDDPPLLLYALGRLDLLQRPALAVVGSRNPTAQGRETALAFAAALSQAGLTVVSGLALGIDGAAHEGALRGPAGTIAVVGTGLDRVYPRQHRDLARRIAEAGVLLSEFPVGTAPLAAHFPQRNRVIAGLSLGTLVVEAALQSGSLITARMALENNREVFAVPGSIHAPQSRGCHALIKQGAKLVESTADILAELRLPPAAPQGLEGPGDTSDGVPGEPDDAVLAALGHDPVTLDVLLDRTGWSTAELGARLLTLELEGRVARLPGQRFQRLVRA